MKTTPTLIPGLRSPYEKLGGIYHLPRMLDKIRIHQEGRLPPDWVAAMGAIKGFDGRTCRFLKIEYAALQAETLKGGSDEELLEWIFAHGRRPSEEEIEIWNGFMSKYGWRDAANERLQFRLGEVGLPTDAVKAMFDFIDLDEGRPVRFS